MASGPADADTLLVLGGGLIGLAIAHQLARGGRAVRVISRNRKEAAGFVAAGMLAPHAEGLEGALLQLGQASLARVPAWVAQIEADSGLACGHRPCGIVVPFATAAERDAYPTAPWGDPLDRAGLEREIAGIGPQWQAGLLFAQDGQIDNRRRLMRALERACTQLGGAFEEGCCVERLITAPAAGDGQPAALEAVELLDATGERLCPSCRPRLHPNAYFLVRGAGAATLWCARWCATARSRVRLGLQEQSTQDPAHPSPKQSAAETDVKPGCGGIRPCAFGGAPELADAQGGLPGVSCVAPQS